jgi:hypothetical protein
MADPLRTFELAKSQPNGGHSTYEFIRSREGAKRILRC